MLYYKNTEIREIDDDLYAEWIANNNPKASAWNPLPDPPAFDPSTHHQPQWDGTQWIEVPISEAERNAYLDSLECTDLQGELALIQFGLYDQYVAAIETAKPALSPEQLAFLNKANVWKYRDPVLQMLASSIGIDQDQLVVLFETAKTK